MKKINSIIAGLLCAMLVVSCGGGTSTETTETSPEVKTATEGSVSKFRLGVQLWSFKEFTFTEAVSKVDSAGIKFIEAFFGQTLGGGIDGKFGPDMSEGAKEAVKKLLDEKGIKMAAFGVISPNDEAEWKSAFELAKYFGLDYITSEPKKHTLDVADSLAGVFGIPVAIHEHANPNPYWHPDSVLAAIQGRKNLGACADVGHWARSGLNPAECIKMLEGHVIGAHLKDIVTFGDAKALDTPVNKGVIEFTPIFEELKRQNFDGVMSIEQESNWLNSLPDIIETRKFYEQQVNALK